ncbi:MAG: prepilin-type N-terminal cleavage/methylation domain-containing protein [Pleurocapsa sp. SU_5_0]|nr:prepilin-type N-terminal cleavage/methylation domain-containing protein [Pleurocapsa sp. SU_5_0]
MNNVFTAKLLQNLNNKKGNKGFTLIELLVVVIIIGVLAAVALPNLLSQVGKARETEGKNGVGTINRSQQAYHFERQTFSPDLTNAELAASNDLGVTLASDYYDFTVTSALSAADAEVSTAAGDGNGGNDDGIRLYVGGINHASGVYTTALCQANKVGDGVPAQTNGVCDDAAQAIK